MTGPLDHVVRALDTAVGGRAAVLHVHGPRGAGKSWSLERASVLAHERGMRVLFARGSHADRELPFAALAALLAPVRQLVDEEMWAVLRRVLDYDHRGAEAFEVKIAAFQFLCALAAEQPTAVLLDDAWVLDAASFDVLSFAVRRADADSLACITADVDPLQPFAGAAARLEALSPTDLGQLVERRGVSRPVAMRCAEAAHGNPGLALALADGLSDDQRAGAAPVAALPRPAGGLADELQRRLREHGEPVCRALVVAAAEHGGEVAAVRAALTTLGEPGDGLAAAEAAGLIEVVGTRIVFADAWTRAAAYHLVAPASRRAAHRALATWFSEPGQAADRAWHLAAGADGPNDGVAAALALLAADTARRGALASAALTSERAAEFAEQPNGRRRHLLAALEWWLDAAGTDGVARVARQLDDADDESAAALDEAHVFLHGEPRTSTPPAPAAGPWGRRRDRRLALVEAGDCGDHRAVVRLVDRRTLDRGIGDDLLAVSIAHRHAGRIREAREHLVRAQAVFDHRSSPALAAMLVDADLDVLQGRAADAARTIGELHGLLPAAWDDRYGWLAGRAALLADPERLPASIPAAFVATGGGELLAVRELVRDGVQGGDAGLLQAAAAAADAHALPVEAGEARLWWAALLPPDERAPVLELARATLQRCGVRGWDGRLALLAQARGAAPQSRPRDPAIDALSQAELRVADAVARGLTNREAASTLLISVKTVDFHLQQIYRKIGVRSRTELAVRMTGHVSAATGERR